MDKEIKHIGVKEGKLLLFGGVYSNLQALEKLISIAQLVTVKTVDAILKVVAVAMIFQKCGFRIRKGIYRNNL